VPFLRSGGLNGVTLPILQSRIPKPEDLAVLRIPVLEAIVGIGKALKGAASVWAIGGDAAEVMLGVNVPADHVAILTSKEGCDEARLRLGDYLFPGPALSEEQLERRAIFDSQPYPIHVRGSYARFDIGGIDVRAWGGLQVKVGDWEWGDPLEFKPDVVRVVGTSIPVVPLRFMSDLYFGLGWIDRAEKIAQAVARSHHTTGGPAWR